MIHPTLRSERGHALFTNLPHRGERQIELTVEVYEKWYGLQVIHLDDRVEEILFPDDLNLSLGTGPCYRDHVPNPFVVRRFAEVQGWHIPPLAYEVMLGRWIDEISDGAPVHGLTLPSVALPQGHPNFEFSVELPKNP